MKPAELIRHRAAYWALMALILLGAGCALYAPALGETSFVFGTDTYSHDYIMHLYGWKEMLSKGQLPLWCPYLFSGFPFIASFALCPFYPTQLLYFVFPHNTAFTMQYVLAVVLGAVFFGLWLRTEKLTRTTAVFGALLYLFSGHVLTLTHAGHLQKMQALAWTPFCLAGVALLSRGLRHAEPNLTKLLSAVGMIACGFAMQLLASHAQIFYGTFLTVALYLGSALFMRGGRLPAAQRKPAAAALGAALAAVLLGGISLSAIQFFPGAEMSRVSNRASGVSFEEAVMTSYPPGEILEYAVSRAHGDSVRGTSTPYFGTWGERIVSDYLGVPALLLAAWGMIVSRRRLRWFLGALLLTSLLIGFGSHTPLYRILYAAAPGFRQFRSPGTFMFLANIALVALASLGVEELVRLRTTGAGRREQAFRMAGLVAALGCVMVALVAVYNNWGVKLEIATAAESRRFHQWRNVIVFMTHAAPAIALLSLGLTLKSPPIRRTLLGLLALIAIALPGYHNRYFLRFEPLAPYLEYLRYQPLYGALRDLPERPLRVLEARSLKSDMILHGVGSPTGYHPVILQRYERLMQELGFTSPAFGKLLSIHYAHTYDVGPPPGDWDLLRRMNTEVVWRRAGAPLEYTFGKRRLVELPSLEECGAHLRDFGVDRDLVIESSVASRLGLAPGWQSVTGNLSSWSPTQIAVKVDAAKAGVLPLAEVYAPGWKAVTEEGNRVPVLPVNIGQRALLVPVGRTMVTLHYAPFSFRLGGFTSMAAITGFLVAVFVVSRWRRWPALERR